MYKIVVADDEALIRKGIISKIEHHAFEFEKVLEAADGREALEIITREQPDIVITDIRMPFLDGIELIRQTRELYPSIRFIIISGYAEFEYAEQALNMGVKGYLLKPIGEKDFAETVKKVIADLDNEGSVKELSSRKEMLERYCEALTVEQKLNQIIHTVRKENSLEDPMDYSELPEIDKNSRFILGLVNVDVSSYYESSFKYQDLELIKFAIINILNEVECECKKIVANNLKDKNQVLILLAHPEKNYLKACGDKFITKAYASIKKYLNISITVGISGVEENLSNGLYRQAKEAFDLRLIYGNNQIFKFGSLPATQDYTLPQNEIRLLRKYIERYDVGNIEIILREIFSEENVKGLSGVYLRMLWIEIINILIYTCSELKLDTANTFDSNLLSEEILDKFNSIDEIVSYLYTTIIEALKLEKVADMNCKNKIRMAMQYIEQHYHEDITVNDIAYSFAMNPNYFSTAFKKEAGKTVINYITDIRIKNACKLLTETQASVVDISRSVGYQDTQYFFRVFRKNTGKTPLEYRKR